MFRVNPNYLKSPAYLLKTVHPRRCAESVGFVCGLSPGLHCCTENILVPFIANGTKTSQHEGALRDTQPRSVFAHCTHSHWCRALGGGEMEVLYSHAVLFLPCVLSSINPVCTHCYAVEHENKNTLPQVYRVSRHELVSALLQNLCSVSSFLIDCFYFGANYCLSLF